MSSIAIRVFHRFVPPRELRPEAPSPEVMAPEPAALEPTAWHTAFSAVERDQLLEDDRFAGTAICLILVAIFLMGLALSIGAIWLAR